MVEVVVWVACIAQTSLITFGQKPMPEPISSVEIQLPIRGTLRYEALIGPSLQ